MKRIIEISEDVYEYIKKLDNLGTDENCVLDIAYEAIRNSTPLNECETENCITKKDALTVAQNEYVRGWQEALRKALKECYSVHVDTDHFDVVQAETLIGLGMSEDEPLSQSAEDFMSTMPSVTPQEPRKGHWVIKDNMWWVCSACGCQTRMMKKYNVPNFCPACGAKMDLEDN